MLKELYHNYRTRCRQTCKLWQAIIIYGIVFIVYSLCFYHQAKLGETGNDITWHIQFAKALAAGEKMPNGTASYPLIYLLITLFAAVFRSYIIGVAVLAGTMAVVTAILTAQFFRYFSLSKTKDLYLVGLSALLQFAWPIYFPFLITQIQTPWTELKSPLWRLCLAAGTSASRHNITSNGVKPFAIIVVWLFLWVLQEFSKISTSQFTERKGKQNLVLLIFSSALFLSVLAKPSFFQAFSFAGAIGVGACLCNIDKSSFAKAFTYCVKIGCAFVPATGYVILQMKTELAGMTKISPFTVWSHYSANIPLGILAAMAFPAFILITQKPKDWYFRFSLILTVVGVAEFALLIQPAEPWSANFMWAYNNALYFLMMASVLVMMNGVYAEKRVSGRQLVAGGLLAAHMITGIYAFFEYIRYFYFYTLQL